MSFRTQHSGKPIASPAIWSGSAPRFVARCAASPPTARSRWCGRLTTTARSSGCGRIWRGRRRPVGRGWPRAGWPKSAPGCSWRPNTPGRTTGVWSAFTKADRPGTSQSARCRPLTTVWDRPLVVSRVNGVDSALDEDHARVGIKKPELAPGLWPGLRLGRQGEAAAVPRFNIRAVRPVAGPEAGRRKCQPPPERP